MVMEWWIYRGEAFCIGERWGGGVLWCVFGIWGDFLYVSLSLVCGLVLFCRFGEGCVELGLFWCAWVQWCFL